MCAEESGQNLVRQIRLATDQTKRYTIEIQRVVRQAKVIHELVVKYKISRLESSQEFRQKFIYGIQSHKAVTTPRELVHTNGH